MLNGCFVIIWFVATNGTLLGEMIPRPDVVCVAFFQAIAGKIGRYNLLVHIGWEPLQGFDRVLCSIRGRYRPWPGHGVE